ncbi:hypothetical protein [Microlunatus sp. GCM10028923]
MTIQSLAQFLRGTWTFGGEASGTDRNRIDGAWTWPGGGYTYAMTRTSD